MKWKLYMVCILVSMQCFSQQAPLYKAKAFTIYPDKVVQGKFEAKAISSTELISNYKSPANEFLSPAITFKFSINGKDNEMNPGVDHHFTCIANNGSCETPLIKFGQQSLDSRSIPDNTYLKPQSHLKIKLDMRDVLNAFNTTGYYTTFKGDKIYKQDFKGVYVAGGTAPLSWDFDNLVNKPGLQMQDTDGDGIYETSLVLNDASNEKSTSASWKQTKDLKAYPQYKSPYPLSDAVYNLAIEEMVNAVEPDSTFRTGKEWAGVWTRDISYSIILAMAHLQPQVAKYSLLRKVKNGRIIQDTGTGGAYPASTDRMIWAVAAYELYKATGDEAWLKQAYTIIKNSVDDDLQNALDKTTGMMKGESSFLDWREQTYPKWMQPVDIYESECLGTNAVHYQANIVLSNMAMLLNDKQSAAKYKQVAQGIKAGMNKYLWMPSKGYYAQFLYGRNFKIVSPRSEALGEALSVLFGIADGDKQKQVISKTPVMDFGIPCIYPQIPNIPPYHNNAVWPFVQSYWALAAAKAGNEAAVMQSIAAIYRPAALWVTNKENFVASNGDFAGTQINSSNMLWSLSGSIALVHKLLFGIQFNDNSLLFKPFVPYALKGKRSLTNFTYRNAVFDIEMDGYGNQIKSFTLDGKATAPTIVSNLRGHHTVKIILANNKLQSSSINNVGHYVTIDAPLVIYQNNTISWNVVKDAVKYIVINKGKEFLTTNKTSILPANEYGEYQVIAVDKKGVQSFASEPVLVAAPNKTLVYEIEQNSSRSTFPYKGFSGDGFVEVSRTVNKSISIPIDIAEDGRYAIDFKYANGNGPINTENKCAMRTLKEGNIQLGTIVLPQRGTGEWSDWGWTNSIQTNLTKGKHILSLTFEPSNENMNGAVNQAMVDFMRVVKL
jgi:hypothetical protein